MPPTHIPPSKAKPNPRGAVAREAGQDLEIASTTMNANITGNIPSVSRDQPAQNLAQGSAGMLSNLPDVPPATQAAAINAKRKRASKSLSTSESRPNLPPATHTNTIPGSRSSPAPPSVGVRPWKLHKSRTESVAHLEELAESDSNDADAGHSSENTNSEDNNESADSEDGNENTDSGDEDKGDTNKVVQPDKYTYGEGIRLGNKLIDNIQDALADMVGKMLALGVDLSGMLGVRVGTACSGTDIPIVMLDMAGRHLHLLESQGKTTFGLRFEHLFSGEIVPFKQSYLNRNFDTMIFRDITDFMKPADEDGIHRAHTIYNTKEVIPRDLDFFICGFCCVDFSAMNNKKIGLEMKGESGDTFFSNKAYLERHEPKIVILENVASAPWQDKIPKKLTEKAKAAMEKSRAIKIDKAVTVAIAKRKKTGAVVDEEQTIQIREEEAEKIDAKAAGGRSISDHLGEAGYRSTFVKINTRNYYIPQVRNRGYLIGIHIRKFTESMPGSPTVEQIERAITEALERWRRYMKMFESPASVTAAAWLAAAEDNSQPGISRVEELEYNDKKSADWNKCKLLHARYRDLNGYGEKRELTHWAENGFRKRPEHWVYFKSMTDRVADVLEIAHLRNVVRGFDDRYYSRYLDLSQNVHREQNSTKDGLIGCLTPKGIPFWTYKGRRLSGRETLALQGLPVNLVDLSQLTDAHLQDFTGNAMTSTTVLAAIFSAILALRDFLSPCGQNSLPESSMDIDVPQPRFGAVQGMIKRMTNPSAVYTPMSVAFAKSAAAQTVCLCHCEGRHEKLDKIFRRCTVCHYTGCMECTGNPTHSFLVIGKEELGLRKMPAYFEAQLLSALPTQAQLSELGNIIESIRRMDPQAEAVSWSILEGYYKAAISTNLHLKKIDRGVAWEAVYQSPQAKLVLTISGTQVVWLLYAIPESKYSIVHPIRQFFEAYAIARLVPVGDDITRGDWEVFVPKYQLIDAIITSGGGLVPSYESQIGLSGHREEYTFDRLHVAISAHDRQHLETDVSGDYSAHPNCGQAFASLHIKTSTENDEASLYFSLEHTCQRGDPREHQFNFTHDAGRQKPNEQRVIVGKLAPNAAVKGIPWRQPRVKREDADGLQENMKYRLSSTEDPEFKRAPCHISKFNPSEDVKIATPGFWILSDLLLTAQRGLPISIQHIPKNSPASLINVSCAKPKGVFECQSEIPEYTACKYPMGEIVRLCPANQVQVLQDFTWVLKRVLSIPGYRCLDISQIPGAPEAASQQWHPFPLPPNLGNCCTCAPSRPRLLWASVDNETHEPYEDPASAAIWERQFKARPNAINLEFFVERAQRVATGEATAGPEDSSVRFLANFQINVNFETLVHKALSELGSTGILRDVTASISLVTNYLTTPRKRFASFHIPDSQWLLNDKEIEGPEEFDDVQLSGAYKLRPEQCRSVAWQVLQEITRPTFVEKIITEEQTIFGYRASAMVSRPVKIGGGCLFHPVGFGKTAVVLGLISMREESDMEWAQEETEKFTDLIPLKASLILVPPQLAQQWKSEVEKFLEPRVGQNILVIQKPGDWNSLSIKDFQDAWIVIVSWKLFDDRTYFENFAQFGGMLGIDGKVSPRAHAAFHSTVMSNIATNINILRSNPSNFESLVNQQIAQNLNDIQSNDLPVPSKRIRGAAYQDKKGRKMKGACDGTELDSDTPQAEDLPKGPVPGGAWQSTKCVPLEAFSWSRVVIDEVSYLGDSVRTSIHNIKKANLWLVSATPGLESFDRAREVALLFGVNLGVQDFALLPPNVWKKSTAGMTVSEKSLSYDRPKSAMWYNHRDDQARAFLKMSAICDMPSYDQINSEEVIALSLPPAAQMAAAQELMQGLAITFNGALPKTAFGKSNVDFQFSAAFKDSKTASQALTRQASVFEHSADPNFGLLLSESNSSAMQTTILCRSNSLGINVSAFMSVLPNIFWLLEHKEAGHGIEAWHILLRCLQNNQWGDSSLCQGLLSTIAAVQSNKVNLPRDEFVAYMQSQYAEGSTAVANGKPQAKAQAHLRDLINKVSITVGKILKQSRALRFMRAVQSCNRWEIPSFDCACRTVPDLEEVIVLTGCGHMVCAPCIHKNIKCPVEGCESGSEAYQRTPGHLFAIPKTHDKASKFGQKAEDLVKLIKSIPKADKVLLFIQHETMIAQVAKILNVAGISNTILNGKFDKQSALVSFQKNQGDKVLLLNIDGASASGLNLTCASHVIFYAPFMTVGSSGQSKYEAAIKQAIGRAVRYGQKAEYVKVYYLITAYSIDVDIYEHRKEKIIVAGEKPESYTLRDRYGEMDVSGEYSSCVPWIIHRPETGYDC